MLEEVKVEEDDAKKEEDGTGINGAKENMAELGKEESENMVIDQLSESVGRNKDEKPADGLSESERRSKIPKHDSESKSLTETAVPVESTSTPGKMEMGSTEDVQDEAQPHKMELSSDKNDDIPVPQKSESQQDIETEMTEASNLGEPIENHIDKPALTADTSTADVLDAEAASTVANSLSPPVPKTPPPYYEANVTANTISLIPLPNASIPTAREAFFPSVPLIAPPKPKPILRCPITGLQARYKDPFTGVGYYDIHAFKILREVARKGGRYVWCSEGGWFIGETGWGGRGAKGVPEGWNG